MPVTATAVVPRTDLARLVASLMPFRANLGEGGGRAVTVESATLDLVSGRGIRLRGSAALSWDLALVRIPVRVTRFQLLLVPRVEAPNGSHVLSLEPQVEELDVTSTPGLVDEKVAAAIRGWITGHRDRLAWDFGRALSKRLPFPENLSPAGTFVLVPVGGEASVSESELRFMFRFEADLHVGHEVERTAAATSVESARQEGSQAEHPTAPPALARKIPHRHPPPPKSRPLRRPTPRPRRAWMAR
jgi:hypothetical protein